MNPKIVNYIEQANLPILGDHKTGGNYLQPVQGGWVIIKSEKNWYDVAYPSRYIRLNIPRSKFKTDLDYNLYLRISIIESLMV